MKSTTLRDTRSWQDLLDERPYAYIMKGFSGSVLKLLVDSDQDATGGYNLKHRNSVFSLIGRSLRTKRNEIDSTPRCYVFILLDTDDRVKAQRVADNIQLLRILDNCGATLSVLSSWETVPAVQLVDKNTVSSGVLRKELYWELFDQGFMSLTYLDYFIWKWCLSHCNLLLNHSDVSKSLLYFMVSLERLSFHGDRINSIRQEQEWPVESHIWDAFIENSVINLVKSLEVLLEDWTGDRISKRENDFVEKVLEVTGKDPRTQEINDTTWINLTKQLMYLRDKRGAHSATKKKIRIWLEQLCSYQYFVRDFLLETLNHATSTSPR